MRIAILGLKGIPATYGGVERYTEELAARLARRGHEVYVYARAHYTSAEAARAPYRGVRIVRLPSLNRRTTDTLSHTLLATLDVMRRRVDVVIYHSLGNAFFAGVPRLFGTPTTLVLHGQEWRKSEWSRPVRGLFRVAERASLNLATRVSVIAHWLEEDITTRYGREVSFVSTAVTLPEKPPSTHLDELGLTPRGYILFVGRLVPQKGPHLLLEAYRGLRTTMPLVIVGDAPHQEAYQRRLRELATEHVRFLGYKYGDELAELYANAYLYVLPSETEGLALSVLEAMSYGNSVVVSDIPPNVEAASPLGFTFRAGDVSDLRRTLQRAVDTPDEVERHRAASREQVALRYNWEAVADHYEQLCFELAFKRARQTKQHPTSLAMDEQEESR